MSYDNVMIDLETMGVNNNAAIIAIGAVAFDFEGNLGPTFYETITLQSSVENGGIMGASTVLWWMRQSDAARKEFERDGNYELASLLDFATYLDQNFDKDVKSGATVLHLITSFLPTLIVVMKNKFHGNITTTVVTAQ